MVGGAVVVGAAVVGGTVVEVDVVDGPTVVVVSGDEIAVETVVGDAATVSVVVALEPGDEHAARLRSATLAISAPVIRPATRSPWPSTEPVRPTCDDLRQ